MKRKHRLTILMTALITAVSLGAAGVTAMANSALNSNDEEIVYMRMKNHTGPSGVALGATGAGYFEIDPTGKVSRTCVNNIHKEFVNYPDGMVVAAYDGAEGAARLARDDQSLYGMQGFTDSYYTGLWPSVELDFENAKRGGISDMGFSAYSGVVAQDVKNSSLPVVFYEVTLRNDGNAARDMSALVSWGDLIGRGLRDTNHPNPSNLDGESSEWFDMATPATYAKGVELSVGGTKYAGVKQYAKEQILPRKATFQNYNNAFMLLAEQNEGDEVSILKKFQVGNQNALSGFTANGTLEAMNGSETPLSGAGEGNPRRTANASAVAVKTTVLAGQSKTVRFALSWYMPEITSAQLGGMAKVQGCDYNKYYHNFFADIETMTQYAIENRTAIREGIADWQEPILSSSMPDWLKFKQINSGYTLYANGVLNKKMNFSTLEGEMGGYGGTMDQKMSSHPFYEKLLPELNMNENRQFANVTGGSGEIQHFDLHYYHGISDFDPGNKVNPTPAGSMTDNTGAWMIQMWNYYAQTGDKRYIETYYDVMKTSMAFIASKCEAGTHIPNYNTTYDDYKHPQILIFSGTVYLNMLDIGARWANVLDDSAQAGAYESEYALTYADVEKLYGNFSSESGYEDYYAFGSDYEYLTSNGAAGKRATEVMFSGAMAGQFMSRYSGLGDVVPFENFVSHMNTFLRSSVQKSNDYFAPKVYNIKTEQDMDNSGSRCWPFYLDSYGGMAAIQAGYLEDGLEILQHTQLVNLRMGYTWTQNLWNPGYSTYMTAPVAWFIGEVLAGSAIDVPAKTLTLGPSCPASVGVGKGGGLNVTLYYPKFWATLDYQPESGRMTYEIIKTFYEENETPITFETVIASPAGKGTSAAKNIALDTPFAVTEGAVLDLGAKIGDFAPATQQKLLKPVNKYVTPKPEKIADGTGLKAKVYEGDGSGVAVAAFNAESVDYRFNAQNKPAESIDGDYTVVFAGRILPRYGQKYQLIFEYTGDAPLISLAGEPVTVYDTTVDAVESQQFTPTPGCKLIVITRDLEAGTFYSIRIKYSHNLAGDGVMRFLWWSTTQQMGLVITERMYPPLDAFDTIRGLDYSASTTQAEGDHVAYTTQNSYALYKDVDFGNAPLTRASLEIMASAPNSDVSSGGKMEIRLGGTQGTLLGTLVFTPNGGWNDYTLCTAELIFSEPVSGIQDICFVFRPNSTFLFNYTEFRFLRGYEDDKYPTSVEFRDAAPVKYLSEGTYFNPVTVNDGAVAEALRYTSDNPKIATVDNTGAVTFQRCGEVTITAKSLHVEKSYTLTITVPDTQSYQSDFSDGADGWRFGTSGKEYDKARPGAEGSTPVIIMDGSDLGSRDGEANSWMTQAFGLKAGWSYELIVRYRSPADAQTNIRIVAECDGMKSTETPWTLTSNAQFGELTLDLSAYAGKIVYISVQQDDHERGSGEIVYVYGVTLTGESNEAETFAVSGKTDANAAVGLYDEEGTLIGTATADAQGAYRFECAAGDYVLKFALSGGTVTKRISVTDGDVRVDDVLTKTSGGKGCNAAAGKAFIPAAMGLLLSAVVLMILRKKRSL